MLFVFLFYQEVQIIHLRQYPYYFVQTSSSLLYMMEILYLSSYADYYNFFNFDVLSGFALIVL